MSKLNELVTEFCPDSVKYARHSDIIMAVTNENDDDVCKCVAWLGNESITVSGHAAIIHHNQNAKEVQCEIVRILDFLTLFTVELTAELAVRKKQYEFYRDKLLCHNGKYPMRSLSDLGKGYNSLDFI